MHLVGQTIIITNKFMECFKITAPFFHLLGSSFFRDDTRLRALRFLDHLLVCMKSASFVTVHAKLSSLQLKSTFGQFILVIPVTAAARALSAKLL